jgi:hypothetical protein
LTAAEADVVRIRRDGRSFRAGPFTGPAPRGGWREVFEVFASEAPDAPALLGAYERVGDEVVFTARFDPSPAVRLRAVFRPQGATPVTQWFGGVPAPPRAPSARVVSITPSADVWPENILRLYLTFSKPMRLGVAWDHIRMLDGDGRPMGGMFVEIDQELWDPEGRRLTVFFDPARIKRGLVDHINEGPPLDQGRRCALEVDAFWRDAAGALLAAGLTKTVSVGPPLRAPIDPAAWRITAPASPDAPLVVDFDRPLDAALALRAIQVARNGVPVAGSARLEADETRFVFSAEGPWRSGAYALVADPVLEDIAGNRIGRPFDIDRKAPGGREAVARGVEIGFEVRLSSP